MGIVRNTGPNFFGDLVKDEGLYNTEIEKKRDYDEVSVSRSDQEEYLRKGWEFKKEVKDTIFLKRKKDGGEILEDEVWLLFKNMGFKEMNRDRNFEIKLGEIKKQIDVFAKDDNNVFVIECKTGSPNLLNDIHAILNSRKDITLSIKKEYGKDFRISFILITKNIKWSESEEKLAASNENKCFFFWKEEELEAYKMIVDQLGDAAKYQLYGLLFPKKKASEVGEIKVPAMRGGKGKNKYYCFLIQPEKLFKIAYVHRREKSNPDELGKSYQRMINKKRIENIGEFIDAGNEFPNNIILNFNQEPQFDPIKGVKAISGITFGVLKFPPYYGCAWIIDGQHRLYGYTKSESKHAFEDTLSVIAFESLNVKTQANLFVDINKEQVPVSSNLLWDLYPDIYYGSEDPHQQTLRTISLIARKLNSDKDSILQNRIQIPSVITKDKKFTNLTLTNVCDAINENKLIVEDQGLLYNNSYEKSIDFAFERINAYFEIISKELNGDWNKGKDGLLRTNVGLRVFFIIFREILRYLDHIGKKSCFTKNDLNDFKSETKKILALVFENLNKMGKEGVDKIRKGSTKGLVLENTQMLVWYVKENPETKGFGAELWLDGRGWSPPIPPEESDESIKKLVKSTEMDCKEFLIKTLKDIHKEKWWENGVPEGVKQNIRRNIDQVLSKAPYERQEINALPHEKIFFQYTSTSDLKEVIKYGSNWSKLSIMFGDAEYMSSHFKSLENVRNAFIGHEERKEEVDVIIKNLGYWGTRWIRRCIGLEAKNIK